MGLREGRRPRVQQDVEALRVRLHEPVLDAVVDHLHEVARADRSAVEIAQLGGAAELAARRSRHRPEPGRERAEHWIQARHHVGLTADHEAVPALEPPDAPARPDVHVVDPLAPEGGGPADVVLVEGVAAVDDHVARRHALAEIRDDLLRRRAGRHHHPDGARGREPLDQLVQRHRAERSLVGEVAHRLGVGRVGDHDVAVAHEPARHVAAHAPESHHPEFHVTPCLSCGAPFDRGAGAPSADRLLDGSPESRGARPRRPRRDERAARAGPAPPAPRSRRGPAPPSRRRSHSAGRAPAAPGRRRT